MSSYRLLIRRANDLLLDEFETPTPAAGELLITTTTSLVSPGTERAFFLGLPNATHSYPLVTGYCAVGEVVQIGDEVQGWQIGDRVVCDGTHSSHLALKANRCFRLPAGLTEEAATFYNMAAIAMQGVRKAKIELGEPVVVIGAGIIGLLAMQLAKLCGALPVIGIDRDARRLELARALGADAVASSDGNTADFVKTICESDGAPVVVEATGNPQAILSAFGLAGRWGRVVLLGSTRGITEQVNFYEDVHRKGLTVIGAHNSMRPAQESSPGRWTSHDDQELMLRLLALGRLNVEPFITHRFAARDAVEAYELLKDPGLTSMGIVLNW